MIPLESEYDSVLRDTTSTRRESGVDVALSVLERRIVKENCYDVSMILPFVLEKMKIVPVIFLDVTTVILIIERGKLLEPVMGGKILRIV